jgi:hypothetical protein
MDPDVLWLGRSARRVVQYFHCFMQLHDASRLQLFDGSGEVSNGNVLLHLG